MIQNGGRLVVDCLLNLGAQRVFGVPGESYLAVLDALYDVQEKIDFTLCRHEGGAAYMAAAYGKLTQRPGICFVTRGPGATNASIGVHTAAQDSVPMLLFVGQVATHMQGREAFQEIDFRAAFGSVAKWATQIDQVERIPEIISRAWKTAISGRPGPVVVALPEDVLSAQAQATAVTQSFPLSEPAADTPALAQVQQLLSAAKRPVLLYGGCNW
ncbi:MAG: thiamine pyrophosphate-binding protein, partial [Pseudomonadota bacterium]